MSRKKPRQQTEAGKTVPREKRPSDRMHPAGPHARPELTDDEATPGTGALPDATKGRDVDPGLD